MRVLLFMLRAAVFGLFCAATTAAAQGVQHISAIVNNEVISAFDVEQRMRVVLFSSGLPDLPETRRRLRDQVMSVLIDERLQLQEANRLDIRLTAEEIESRILELAAQSGVTVAELPQFLSRRNIQMGTILNRVRAEIAWQKLVTSRFRGSVNVTNEEVEEVLQRLQANRGKPQHLVSEIFLSVNDPQEEPDVLADAQKLRDEIARGANFEGIAQQFSHSATAASGGMLGWVQPGQIAPELERTLLSMPEGEVSDPVRSEGGFYILRLADRQRILEVDPRDTRVTLKLILLPIKEPRNEANIAAARQQATTLARQIGDCAAFEKIAAEEGGPGSGNLGILRVGDMPRDLATTVASLAVGEISDPLVRDSGLQMLMVCDRVEPEIEIPDAAQIRVSLLNSRLALMARRYLRDLRRDAVIEYR